MRPCRSCLENKRRAELAEDKARRAERRADDAENKLCLYEEEAEAAVNAALALRTIMRIEV